MPKNAKTAPARRTLYQGVSVFGSFPPVTVVVGVVDEVGVVEDVVDGVVVEVVDPGVVVEVVDDVDVVDVVVTVAQIPFVMVLVSSVTAPVCANNCPCTVAPVFAVMDA